MVIIPQWFLVVYYFTSGLINGKSHVLQYFLEVFWGWENKVVTMLVYLSLQPVTTENAMIFTHDKAPCKIVCPERVSAH